MEAVKIDSFTVPMTARSENLDILRSLWPGGSFGTPMMSEGAVVAWQYPLSGFTGQKHPEKSVKIELLLAIIS